MFQRISQSLVRISSAHQLRRNLSSCVDPTVADRLSQLGVDSALHKKVVSSLASVFGKQISVSTVDKFGEEGIKALVQSIQAQRPKGQGVRKKREITISIPHHRTEFKIMWRQGESFMQVAQDDDVLREYIEASCGGTMACCSCHIYLDPDSYAAVGGKPSVEERDMLDLAHDLRKNSRLGCQVYLNDDLLKLDDVVVTIPDGVNNVW